MSLLSALGVMYDGAACEQNRASHPTRHAGPRTAWLSGGMRGVGEVMPRLDRFGPRRRREEAQGAGHGLDAFVSP